MNSSVIHLQFWAYGSWASLFPISMSPTANLWVQNTIFNDKSVILLNCGNLWNKNFASQRQNYAQMMQDAQVTKSWVSAGLKFTSDVLSKQPQYCSDIWKFLRTIFYHTFLPPQTEIAICPPNIEIRGSFATISDGKCGLIDWLVF